MKIRTRSLLAIGLAGTLLLPVAGLTQQEVTTDSDALSQVPPPVSDEAGQQLRDAAGSEPYAPGGTSVALPPAPETAATVPPAMPSPVGSSLLYQPITSQISVAQMGHPQGVALAGGQQQSGIIFTLPGDQVITSARLKLSLSVSPQLAARATTLQLMLNGQPLGTLPLNATDNDVSHYQLDIPAAMVVSSNNLSFRIADADNMQCQRDSSVQNQLTILPATTLMLEGQQLNTGTSLRNFPRPFIDPLSMTAASVAMGFDEKASPEAVSAAVMVASWLGIREDYRGIDFPVVKGTLPEKNGILFGKPGDSFGGMVLPAVDGPTLTLMDNPNNPVYKLMLVTGNDEAQLRQAARRLINQPLATDSATLKVKQQTIPLRKAYDAPRWIDTSRPVRLSELLRKDQSMTVSGLWHDALRVNFRAAPDLFLWDGDTIPVTLNYRFPSESWMDEENSSLNVSLNGTFLRNLTVNKRGLLESVWHRLGGDARQENYTIQIDPWMIFGDNQLALYFDIKPKADAPCAVLMNNNIKSRIDDSSQIDLSNTRHFTLLPNLSYFVGASFPFSRHADFSRTTLLLPENADNAEISTLLGLAARAGSATGVALAHNQVLFGVPKGGALRARLAEDDILAVTTTQRSGFNQNLLAGSPFESNGSTLRVRESGFWQKVGARVSGHWYRQPLDADRYLSSNEARRGFVSYRSPWNSDRLVVMSVATSDQQLLRLNQDLGSAKINAGIRGDTAIITDENGIRSYRVGPQFPSGEMPWYMMIVWYANQHSAMMALVALLLSAVVGAALWVKLKRHAARRLGDVKPDRRQGQGDE